MDKEAMSVLDAFLKYGTMLITFIVGVWAWYKFNKQHEINREIESLKSQFAQNQTILNSTINSLTVERHASQERRIVGVEVIWKEVLFIRQLFAPIAYFYSILLPEEYEEGLKNHPIVDVGKIESLFGELYKKDLEAHRPFLGEKLWFAFWTYRAFQGRVAFNFIQSSKKTIQDWREDALAIEHLDNVLNKNEVELVKKYSPLGSLTVAINLVEYKILEEIHSLLSGEKAAENSYKNAVKYAEGMVKVERN